jgi:hypothetical protein
MAKWKWQTVDNPTADPSNIDTTRLFTSEAKAYAYVNEARAAFLAGVSTVAVVKVHWLDGDKWLLFDSHDFAAGE